MRGPVDTIMMTDAELAQHAAALDQRSPEEILAWAAEQFPGRIGLATGFGVEGCLLVSLIGRQALPIDVFTLDTGLFFPETYALWRTLELRYGLTIRAVRPRLSVEQQAADVANKLWAHDPDRCCRLRKVEPLAEAVHGLDAWVSAIRRDQTSDRADARVLERDTRFGIVKVNPLAHWSVDDVWEHVRLFDVPFNPLHEHGYPSIGCYPCTSRVSDGEDPRAGRWRARQKTECGLHARRVIRLTETSTPPLPVPVVFDPRETAQSGTS